MSRAGQCVMVTGGAGFIGSELTRQLAAKFDKVLVVDNLVNGTPENLEAISTNNVWLHRVDIRDQDKIDTLMKSVDVVYHLACLGVRHSIHSPHENHDVNATATLGLLSLARKRKVKRFVYVSSSEVYGTAEWVPMSEQHPAFPETVYGGGKLAGECYARAYHRTYGFPSVVVRPFNSYGPRCHHEGDSGEVIPKFLLRSMAGKPMVIFGDGQQTRDFTYVEDTARGIMIAGLEDRAIGQTINIGQGRETSIRDLASHISQLLGQDKSKVVYDQARPGDVLRLCSDSTLAREILGFSPTIGFEEGLQRLKNWYIESEVDPVRLVGEEVVHNWKSAE